MATISKKLRMKYDVEEIDWTVRIYVPVTLRQIAAAGVTLDSRFGCDEEEHARIRDELGILRLRVDSEIRFPDGEGHHKRNEYSSGRNYDVEALSATLAEPDARWAPCVARSEFARGGESGLREWNRRQAMALARLAQTAVDAEAESVLSRLEQTSEKWAFENQTD